ncbi:MAG: UDP-N-acetylenolpyruvoylglucosamine reductase [Alphaproteobacteria bacterium CG_4_10_14_0_2_um_filter_63_37]|nr:MAG: UDP-N-acetylenolpyruvoylglucosamine reductase [Proteobacteria bacterium CG1_02_64_396]PJA24592.1 MAG: UDP-N-acetylenolpyruvoylglucosamine reductase [Alphaproteobacteria bacterium CG_4_10_14_0_2_um_filter_63_37]
MIARPNEPMALHTTWHLGGAADWFLQPETVGQWFDWCRDHPVEGPLLVIGRGSNILVRDGGVAGTVLSTKQWKGLTVQADGRVRAEAGVAVASLSRAALDKGLTGIEFLVGIPGSVGGAIRMNAGAHGGEIGPLVTEVVTCDRHGKRKVWRGDEIQWRYRHSSIPEDQIVVEVALELRPGEGGAIRSKMAAIIERRNATQPLHRLNAGSVFRNPDGDYAARLIEAAGLKGAKVGGAQVDPMHANFITHEGDASAADVERLIAMVQEQVHARFGVTLVREVQIVGRPA